jgi:putative oxidoreductase
MDVGRLAARAVIGGLFVGHGTQKLFGWFGGPGRAGTEAMMESLELRPPKAHALAAGLTETVGGSLLAAGLATPVAAAALTGVMTTAIRKVHGRNGPWVTGGGWEYNAVLIAAVAAIADHGPGRPSVDAALLPRFKGPAWALLAVGAGVASSYLMTSEAMNPVPQTGPAEQSGSAGDPASSNGSMERETAGAGA